MAQSSSSNAKAAAGNGLTRLLLAGLPALLAAVWLYYPSARLKIFGEAQPSVTINQGTVVGRLIDDGKFPAPIEGFMGIPYALPPVNDLRFRPAVPVSSGNGTLEAFYMGPRSVQHRGRGAAANVLQMSRQATGPLPRGPSARPRLRVGGLPDSQRLETTRPLGVEEEASGVGSNPGWCLQPRRRQDAQHPHHAGSLAGAFCRRQHAVSNRCLWRPERQSD